jgi:hypothetical protein
MQGIKFTCGAINKRVNEKIESYDRLIDVVRQLFENSTDTIHIWYLINGERRYLINEEDFETCLGLFKEALPKLEVQFEKHIDYILENVGISESFAIYEKIDSKLKASEPKAFEEKGTQNYQDSRDKETETFIHTSELATNTVIVNKTEKETQVVDKELMISKIDEVLSSKLKQMEDKFEIMFRRLENSKVYDSKIEPISEYKQDVHKENLVLAKPFDHTFTSFNENSDFFKEEYCSRCKYQIIANKYICMLCIDYKLCSQCERTHTEHPLLKININCKSITTKEELIGNILSKNNTKEKKGLIKTITSMFNSDSHIVHISPNHAPLKFAMPFGDKLVYNILLQNAGKRKINEPVIVSVINNKNFIIKDNNKTIPALEIYENKELEFLFESPEEEGIYYLELTAYGGGKNLKVEPVKLEIHVIAKEQCEERNADLFFSDYEEAADLPIDKKLLLYRIVDEKITELDIPDIIAIMRRHNFDLLSALDELTKSEPEESL